jgi:hypothetical protein
MNLQKSGYGRLSIVPAHGGTFRSSSAPNSVSHRKKPASMAGFLYLFLNMTSADRSFSSQDFTTPPPRSLQLLIQTPTTPNPA